MPVAIAAMATALGIGIAAIQEPTPAAACIAAREGFGLAAAGFLIACLLIGPLAAVCPRWPLAATLLRWRRSVGVASALLVVPHLLCYLIPVFARNWRELYAPGWWWTLGLFCGLVAGADLAVLAWTSRDVAIARLGGRRWKRLHRSVYGAFALVFLHALATGSDFGLAHPPDVQTSDDIGCLTVFSSLSIVWVGLLIARRGGWRWPARIGARPPTPGSTPAP